MYLAALRAPLPKFLESMRLFPLVGFLLTLMVCFPTHANSEIQNQLASGNYAIALRLLEQKLTSHPDDVEARFLQGVTFVLLRRPEQASSVFLSLSREYPQLPEPANNLAVLQAQRGDLVAAQSTLEGVLQKHPDYSPAYENLGDVFTARAEAAYARAQELDASGGVLKEKQLILSQLRALPDEQLKANEMFAANAPKGKPERHQTAPVSAVVPLSIQEPVLATLEQWRQAWAAGDSAQYLSHYAADFRPSRGMKLADWRAQRRARVRPDKVAKIAIRTPKLSMANNDIVWVEFEQKYQSRRYSDLVRKRMGFLNSDGRWQIQQELVLP